ncbi:MAG: EAL domain-containing protein [Gallionellaceae bacterium]|nr:EAL domain-containing protein [Gallionellaceae bacterium]
MKNNKSSKVKILIVEDSPTQAEQLAHLLEQRGYAVTTASNGREALAVLEHAMPTLVISDVLMPELDGYGLCKAIKSDDRLKHLPVMLVTALSDPQDIIRGLECGADNFIRKPYDERYLLSHIEYLLMNLELRKTQKMQTGVEIRLGEHKHFITAERQQMLDLLISIYEQAIHLNQDLKLRDKELEHSNEVLNGLYRIADGLNHANGEREVAEITLERALELPGIQAGWISLRTGETGFRLAASRNLPPALAAPGAMEGDCLCRRRLAAAGELDHSTNIIKCERLEKARGDTQGLRYHASVPLWVGDRTLGVMNLVGPEEGLFNDAELKILYGVGHQVAVALERARLQENLEQLVKERTAALRQSESWFRAVFNSQQDAVFVTTPEGKIINANSAVEKIFGYTVAELKGRSMALLQVDEQHYVKATQYVQQALAQNSVIHFEHQLKRKNGGIFPTDHTLSPLTSETGASDGIVRVIRDITLRKEHEARIMRLNRVYAVLSDINSTIVRTHNRQELFDEACRIAVEQGQFRFAWIGLLDANGVDITPAARAGFEEGYLGNIRLTARDDVPDNCKLVAQALREKTTVVCNDIATDPRMMCCREEALRRGYHSIAALPLRVGEQVVGLFSLYAVEKDFFDTEEMRLLTEIDGDISFGLDHIEKEERLNYLAYYDELTGLPNRTLFYDRLNQLLHTANKQDVMVALLLINVDRFRDINETLGWHGGDALLRQVAQRLGDAVLNANHLAHIDAGYFAVALDNIQKEADAAHFLEHRITTCLTPPFVMEGKELRISAKAGIALFPSDGADADALFRNADAALKKARLTGDKYLFYTPELNARVAENLMLENKLRRALEQRQFVLHYQPKVDLKTGKISGLEALMRWNDPDDGLVPPVKFIPLLEESGLILDAGRWALEQAVADFQRWQANGLKPPRVAVNVSAIQLRHKDFVGMVRQVLNSAEGMAASLGLEITESMIMHDIEANIQKLQAIRDMGVKLEIDDFGTGYSSLSYLTRLPINTLKIDQSFIANMTSSPTDLSIVSTIISLGHSMDLKIIAEGVETEEQKKLLQLLKCNEMQGYLFSKPLPSAEIEAMLGRNAK